MKGLYVTIFAALISLQINGQVIVKEEPAVTRLMQVYKSANVQEPVIRAWRLQITTTSNRREMESTYKKFERLYPHIPYKWDHDPPYYKVKVGAYEKKEDLEAFLLDIKRDFPLAIPVQDDIPKTELLDN